MQSDLEIPILEYAITESEMRVLMCVCAMCECVRVRLNSLTQNMPPEGPRKIHWMHQAVRTIRRLPALCGLWQKYIFCAHMACTISHKHTLIHTLTSWFYSYVISFGINGYYSRMPPPKILHTIVYDVHRKLGCWPQTQTLAIRFDIYRTIKYIK